MGLLHSILGNAKRDPDNGPSFGDPRSVAGTLDPGADMFDELNRTYRPGPVPPTVPADTHHAIAALVKQLGQGLETPTNPLRVFANDRMSTVNVPDPRMIKAPDGFNFLGGTGGSNRYMSIERDPAIADRYTAQVAAQTRNQRIPMNTVQGPSDLNIITAAPQNVAPAPQSLGQVERRDQQQHAADERRCTGHSCAGGSG